MSEYRELLLGCGHSRDKRMNPVHGRSMDTEWCNLVTLDNYNQCKPDLLCNMDRLGKWHVKDWNETGAPCLAEWQEYPYLQESLFDEIHAYEVLEHLGQLGDEVSYFSHFSEIWRILKPDGFLCGTVPSRYSPWLWGDPSHRRLINNESLSFLDQDNYKQLDGLKPSPMSDFRRIYTADFKIVERQDNHKQFFFILQAVKPSRVRERIP